MNNRIRKSISRLAAFSFALALVLQSSASFSSLLAVQNWDRFHGPNGTGVAKDSELPTKWSGDDYLWASPLPGTGSSSPVIWEDKVFITSCDAESGELTVQCLNLETGKPNWSSSFPSAPYKVHGRNSFASATPAVDADHVYVMYANPQHTMLIAINHAGQKVWERDFGSWVSQHGFSMSPIVYKDKVIFFNSQQHDRVKPGTTPGSSRVIAVNRKDGSDVWTSQLKATRACYAVPAVFTNSAGEDQIITCNTGDGFFSIDPETGVKNWATLPFKMRTVAATLIVDGMLIGSNGSGGGGNYLTAVRLDDGSTDKAPKEAYTIQKANYVPSPIAVNGMLFFFTDKGVGNCVDLQTGETHWRNRIAAGFSGSPVATSSHVYVMDEEGTAHVIAASKDFKLVSEHDLGEPSRSTPAIAGNKILFRTESNLICVGK